MSEQDDGPRMVRTYLVASSFLGPIYGGLFVSLRAWWCSVMAVAFTVACAVGWRLYRSERYRGAARVLVASFFVAPVWAILFTGGLYSPAVIWLAPATFMAGSTLGAAAAARVGLLGIAFELAVAVVGVERLPQEMAEPVVRHMFSVAVATGGLSLLAFYAWATTSSYVASRAELAAKHQEAIAVSHLLDERNRAMRVVFDNVEQGFLTIGLDGEVGNERSMAIDRWFRAPRLGEHIATFLEEFDRRAAEWMAIGLEGLAEGFLPRELALDQLPKSLEARGHNFRLEYRCVGSVTGEVVVMLVITDQTEALRAEAAERRNAELLEVLRFASRDRAGLVQFLRDSSELVARIVRSPGEQQVLRDLHTLRGNTRVVGLHSFADVIHGLEERFEERRGLDAEALDRLQRTWGQEVERIDELGFRADDGVRLGRSQLEALQRLASSPEVSPELRRAVDALSLSSTRPRLENLGRHALRLCQNIEGKSVRVVIDDEGVQVAPGAHAELWCALVHIVRNAIDHGLESEAERQALGKPKSGELRLSSRARDGFLTLEIADDGCGVDFGRIAEKARAAGLPHGSHAELVVAMFSDGVSTREEVTELSGRGVGTSAVLAAVQAYRGSLEVDSTPGQGSCFRFVLPLEEAHRVRPAA